MSLVRVDWDTGDVEVENPFYMQDESGNKSALTTASVREWAIGFLSEEFQPRSFKDGLEAGLRVL